MFVDFLFVFRRRRKGFDFDDESIFFRRRRTLTLTAADTAVSLRPEIQLSSRTLFQIKTDPRPDSSGLG